MQFWQAAASWFGGAATTAFFAWYQLTTVLVWSLVVRRYLVGNAATGWKS